MTEEYLFTNVLFTDVKEEYKKQITAFEWRAAKFLAKLLDDNAEAEKLLGEKPRLFLLTEDGNVISFAVLSRQDCIDAPELFPWIGFVHTAPEHRNCGYCRKLLNFICSRAAEENVQKIYLATDHIGLYEKMNFEYLGSYTDKLEGCEDRVYFRKIQKQDTDKRKD